ncbi:MAG: hypothetical protein ACREE2_15655, partial [Stellaceae bacterium]
SEPGAANVSMDDRKVVRRCADPVDDRPDFRDEASGQVSIARAAPIARLDQLGACPQHQR